MSVSSAVETFAARQTQGADLKVRVDRAPSLNDGELAELRAEIKVKKRRRFGNLHIVFNIEYSTS